MEQIRYTPEELKYRTAVISRLEEARDARDKTYDEFDGLCYTDHYKSNRRARIGYIAPKENDQEVRVTTGTTREKVNSLLSNLVNYNFQPDIQAYNKSGQAINLYGDNVGVYLGDLDQQQKNIEDYESIRVQIYDEFLTQGSVFVEKSWQEQEKIIKNLNGKDFDKATWTETTEKYGEIKTTLLCGLNVFLGDIRQSNIDLQPYIFTREVIPYEVCESIFGTYKKFQYVSKDLTGLSFEIDSEGYWTLYDCTENRVEVIRYQDSIKNEYNIYLNGVQMLKPGFPLEALSGLCQYTVAKSDCEPIPGFAYGRGISFKSKVDQGLLDEMMRAIVVKTRQSFNPPFANNTNRVLTSKIFNAGTQIQGINPEQIKPLIAATGVTQSEFNTFEFIKNIVDEKTVSPTFAGQITDTRKTAYEISQAQRQSMVKIGVMIAGIVSLEARLSWLNLYLILKFWMDEKTNYTKNKIQRWEVDVDFDEESGTRVIEFGENALEDAQFKAQSNILSDHRGTRTERVIIPRKLLKGLENKFFITITPTEKQTSELKKAMFTEQLAQGFQLFGLDSWNMGYLQKRYVNNMGESPEKALSQAPPPQQPGMMPMNAQQQPQPNVLAQLQPKKPSNPSISALLGQ